MLMQLIFVRLQFRFFVYLVLRGIRCRILGIRRVRFLVAYVFQLYLGDLPFSRSFLALKLQLNILDIYPFNIPQCCCFHALG
jgi:hypothetical protein